MQQDILIIGVLFPAIPLMMVNFGNRYTVLANLIRHLHDEVIRDNISPTDVERFLNQINQLRDRLRLIGIIQSLAAARDCIIPIKRKRSLNWFIWLRKRSTSVGEILSLMTSSCRCLIRLAKTVYRFPKFTIINGMAGNKTPIIKMSCCIHAFIAT